MRLSNTAEYALRALTYMSVIPEDLPIKAKDLSAATGIPSHYLSKIMRKLVTAKLLHSQKGHGGGFVFAKPMTDIRFVDIINAVGRRVEPKACVFGWGECNEDDPCPVHFFWSEFIEHFNDCAEKYTLSDVNKYKHDVRWEVNK